MPIALHEWESTIQQIVDEYNQEDNRARKHKLLTDWRSKLAKLPPHLEPFQIDAVIREVRRRIGKE